MDRVCSTKKMVGTGFVTTKTAIATDALQSIGTTVRHILRGVRRFVETGNGTETEAKAGRKMRTVWKS